MNRQEILRHKDGARQGLTLVRAAPRGGSDDCQMRRTIMEFLGVAAVYVLLRFVMYLVIRDALRYRARGRAAQ